MSASFEDLNPHLVARGYELGTITDADPYGLDYYALVDKVNELRKELELANQTAEFHNSEADAMAKELVDVKLELEVTRGDRDEWKDRFLRHAGATREAKLEEVWKEGQE